MHWDRDPHGLPAECSSSRSSRLSMIGLPPAELQLELEVEDLVDCATGSLSDNSESLEDDVEDEEDSEKDA